MAGIERDTPIPTDIRLHKKSRILELCYEDGERFELACEKIGFDKARRKLRKDLFVPPEGGGRQLDLF